MIKIIIPESIFYKTYQYRSKDTIFFINPVTLMCIWHDLDYGSFPLNHLNIKGRDNSIYTFISNAINCKNTNIWKLLA